MGPILPAHGVTGTWWDEVIELGIPVGVLVVLYVWSSRKPAKNSVKAEHLKK